MDLFHENNKSPMRKSPNHNILIPPINYKISTKKRATSMRQPFLDVFNNQILFSNNETLINNSTFISC